jgi:hypothetical protein
MQHLWLWWPSCFLIACDFTSFHLQVILDVILRVFSPDFTWFSGLIGILGFTKLEAAKRSRNSVYTGEENNEEY